MIPRLLVPPSAIQGESIRVTDPATLRHLRVLRMKVGNPVECLDGAGCRYQGRITRMSPRSLEVLVTEPPAQEPAARVRVALGQSLLPPERFEWLVQKATELGVDRIIPLTTARTVVRPGPDRVERKLSRWRRIAQEAALQCGRARLPTVEPLQPLDRLLRTCPPSVGLLMPTLAAGAIPLAGAVADAASAPSVIVLIGPEGDFTPEEVALGRRAGATPVTLGRMTLRSETAAIATLAILQHALGAL